MALLSEQLSGDPKLEAAAVSDPAHILPGARGDHVKKIQQALNTIMGTNLALDSIYGPATAAAVLAYKTSRAIINRAYQSKPDNIVGKLTITALDLELLALSQKPGLLIATHPRPIHGRIEPQPVDRTARPRLAFAFSGDVVGDSGGGGSNIIDIIAAPTNQQVVIPRNRRGRIEPLNFEGGTLIFTDAGNKNVTGDRVAKLITGTNLRSSGNLENADIRANKETFEYQSFAACGVARMQAAGPGTKKSAVTEVFVLVDKSDYAEEELHPVEPGFDTDKAKGLISKEGTPLNPLPGLKINLFGRGESRGFANYSTSIPFCNDSGGHTKPWTNDPRKPSVGIENGSVKNICIRGSPIEQITITEIDRIRAPGCRLTFTAPPTSSFIKTMRDAFSGKSEVQVDKTFGSLHALLFQFP